MRQAFSIDVPSLDWATVNWSTLGDAGQAFALVVSVVLLYMTMRDRRRDRRARRRSQAEHVSGWVDDRYIRDDQTGRLVRRTFAHLRNTGTQPVYDVSAVVGHGYIKGSVRAIGTLGLPALVPVLPPDADQDWEITGPLQHFVIEGTLRVELMFRDPGNVRWHRDFEGVLREQRKRAVVVDDDDQAAAQAQLGMLSPDNPTSVALAFVGALAHEDYMEHIEDLRRLCTPESVEAWGDFSEVRVRLQDRGLGTFPEYPAPGVAYVRLPASPRLQGRATGPVTVDSLILTLQQRPDIDGHWHVHSVGLPCLPEALPAVGV